MLCVWIFLASVYQLWIFGRFISFLLYYLAYAVYIACSDIQGELTYGKIGEWRFDKRSYDDIPPPRNLSLPPPGVPESVVSSLSAFNVQTLLLHNWSGSILFIRLFLGEHRQLRILDMKLTNTIMVGGLMYLGLLPIGRS